MFDQGKVREKHTASRDVAIIGHSQRLNIDREQHRASARLQPSIQAPPLTRVRAGVPRVTIAQSLPITQCKLRRCKDLEGPRGIDRHIKDRAT